MTMSISALVLACLTFVGASGQTGSLQSFSEHFVEANGIRLHYLDWGGQGEPLVFLTGSRHLRQVSTIWLLAFAAASVCTG